jgi:hypothetical protein
MEPPVIVHLTGMVYSGETMKRLYATADPTEAAILRSILREAGIESTLDEEDGAIHVGNEDAPKAAEILAAHFEKQDPRDTGAAEESSLVKTRVRRSGSLTRVLAITVVLLPAATLAIMLGYNGDVEQALLMAGALGGMVAAVWIVNVMAEKKDGSAPR